MEERFKVLVVDDEKDNTDMLFRYFRREYDVLKAYSGFEGLDILKNEGGNVAVIISDMKMPKMDGAQFLEKSLEFAQNATRIILSGYSDSDDLLKAINKAKVYMYLLKPFDNDKLREYVEIGVELFKQKKAAFESSVLNLKQDLPTKEIKDVASLKVDVTAGENFKKEISFEKIFLNTDKFLPVGSKIRFDINIASKSFAIHGEVSRISEDEPKGMDVIIK